MTGPARTTTWRRGAQLLAAAMVATLLPAGAASASTATFDATTTATTTDAVAGASADELLAEALFLQLYNEARQDPTAWYPAATEDPQPAMTAWTNVRDVARAWSDEMAVANKLAHNPSYGDQLCCWRRAGENVGVTSGVGDRQTVEDAVRQLVTAFMASDGHRSNMTNPDFDQFGVGVTITDGGRLWVAINFQQLATGATPQGVQYDAASTLAERDALLAALLPVPTARDFSRTCDTAQRNVGDDAVAVPSFLDIVGNVHQQAIECVAAQGVASGRLDGTFGPGGRLNRGQIATFLVRALEAVGATVADADVDHFSDDDGTTHEDNINRLAALGAVDGDEYRPFDDVTRAEMATMLIAALRSAGLLDDTAAATDWFTDDTGHAAEDAINLVAELGLVTGRSAGHFEPDATLTRGQMATFLARTLDLAHAPA